MRLTTSTHHFPPIGEHGRGGPRVAGRPPFFRPDPEKTFLSTVSRIRIRIEPGKVASGDRSLRSEDLPGGEADLATQGQGAAAGKRTRSRAPGKGLPRRSGLRTGTPEAELILRAFATGRSHETGAGGMKSCKNVPGLFSVEEQVREKGCAGFVRIGGKIRNSLRRENFLVDEEVPRTCSAVAREDRAGRIGHDLRLSAV